MIDLSVDVGGLHLVNPVMPASGTISTELASVIDFNRLGALVPKTITRFPRVGNPQPRLAEVVGGMVSSIGIPGKGLSYFLEETVPFYRRFRPPVVASVSADTPDAFAALARDMSVPGVAAIELNLSCPNLEAHGRAFAMDAGMTRETLARVKAATDLPLWAKLTPNVGDIAEVARAAEAGGAAALVVANAFVAMVIDVETFRPRLGSVTGGITGPGVKPILLHMAYKCARAVSIPVIGCGGIISTEDAVEYMLAGASAVQVGTATFVHPDAMLDMIDGLAAFCERKGIARVRDLTGAMRPPAWTEQQEALPA